MSNLHIPKNSRTRHRKSIPLTFHHNGTTVIFYFAWFRYQALWITHGANGQTIMTEEEVCQFLSITPRTARAWRNATGHPCQNSLLLLYLHMTGRIVPFEFARRGTAFSRNQLLTRYGPLDAASLEILAK